jgi:hypothetical protein
MSEDIASRIAYLKSDADAVKAFRADMDEAIEMLLGQANNIATVAVEIERKAIEQSETVQRDWASPVEVAGMKARIAALESAAAWVPVAQRLPEDDGSLDLFNCSTKFTGNDEEIVACKFWCTFLFDGEVMTDVVWYNFESGSWELKFEGTTIDITVTHWKPLSHPPEDK